MIDTVSWFKFQLRQDYRGSSDERATRCFSDSVKLIFGHLQNEIVKRSLKIPALLYTRIPISLNDAESRINIVNSLIMTS